MSGNKIVATSNYRPTTFTAAGLGLNEHRNHKENQNVK